MSFISIGLLLGFFALVLFGIPYGYFQLGKGYESEAKLFEADLLKINNGECVIFEVRRGSSLMSCLCLLSPLLIALTAALIFIKPVLGGNQFSNVIYLFFAVAFLILFFAMAWLLLPIIRQFAQHTLKSSTIEVNSTSLRCDGRIIAWKEIYNIHSTIRPIRLLRIFYFQNAQSRNLTNHKNVMLICLGTVSKAAILEGLIYHFQKTGRSVGLE